MNRAGTDGQKADNAEKRTTKEDPAQVVGISSKVIYKGLKGVNVWIIQFALLPAF